MAEPPSRTPGTVVGRRGWPLRGLITLGCVVVAALVPGSFAEPLIGLPRVALVGLLLAVGGAALHPRLPKRWLPWIAVPIAVVLNHLLFSSHVGLPLPLVDRVRVRGLQDSRAWLQDGLLLCLVAAPRALGRVRAWPSVGLAVIAATLVVSFWSSESTMRIDRVEPPVDKGKTVSVIEHGEVVERAWIWGPMSGRAYDLMPWVLAEERVLAAITEGAQQAAEAAAVAGGERTEAAATRHTRVRRTLWTIQQSATAAWLWLDAASIVVAIGIALLGLKSQIRQRPAPRVISAAGTGYLRLVLFGPLILNLLILSVAVAALPDGARHRISALGLTALGLLGAALAERAGATQ